MKVLSCIHDRVQCIPNNRSIVPGNDRSTRPDDCAESLGALIPGAGGAEREFLFEQVRMAGGAKAVAWMRRFATGPDGRVSGLVWHQAHSVKVR